MKSLSKIAVSIFILFAAGIFIFAHHKPTDSKFITYIVNPKKDSLKCYWKDANENRFGNIQNLINSLKQKNTKLLFAMNGGMYNKDHAPQGLYIESGKKLSPIDESNGGGNFYMKPNGVFFLKKGNLAGIVITENFKADQVKYATQSGPMLVIDGQIHASFKQGSTNLNIRNGVGILPNGSVVFAMSKDVINFYDFAEYFKDMGCKNALYLDGLVSRTYSPKSNWIQTDGDFGVIIGVTKSLK